jgi:hypothetical protein
MSCECTNHVDGLLEPTLVVHTCTVPADSPPVIVKLAVCAADACVVSMIELQSVPSGDFSVT